VVCVSVAVEKYESVIVVGISEVSVVVVGIIILVVRVERLKKTKISNTVVVV
jgi:hypothetical protein